jgi:uncharacterized LabA/DUF88 family protein
MDSEQHKNYAFIDGQNLHMGTAINMKRFRVYLAQKYHVEKAYYFLGYIQDSNQDLYEEIQNAGFILMFRDHSSTMVGTKKGNVDSDIIFHIMKKVYKREDFNSIILVSGDGDYKLLVDFLIEERRFEKILFPNKKFASSLYKKIGSQYYDSLENARGKIEVKKKGAP